MSIHKQKSVNSKISQYRAPVAVIMISLNEGHNMVGVLENLKGWAQEIFLVDSYSSDDTVDIALRYGVNVVQRKFRGFGDQWNFALRELPVTAPWTMKLDPDERLSDELKKSILEQLEKPGFTPITFVRRLWFMGQPLTVNQEVLRMWKTGSCRFSDVSVNEHPIVEGKSVTVKGELVHLDSPSLEHWLDKQNRYSSAEAYMSVQSHPLSAEPRFFGNDLERRMWFKTHFNLIPGRYILLFIYFYIFQGAWRSGWVGLTWVKLRVFVMRIREMKIWELRHASGIYIKSQVLPGQPDIRVQQFD